MAIRVAAGLAILVAVMAFALNSLLVLSAVDGKRLIERVETEAGRELSGYELYSEHREVNDYYYPARELQENALYFFNALSVPWIIVSVGSLVVVLCVSWRSSRMRTAVFGSLAIMIALLAVVTSHLTVIEKIAWAIE